MYLPLETEKASAGSQKRLVASGEVEDRSGKLDFAGQFGVGFEQLLGTGTSVGDHVGVLDHAQQLQTGLATGLGISQHVAGTAEFQIGLCDFGAIKRVVNDIESLFGW